MKQKLFALALVILAASAAVSAQTTVDRYRFRYGAIVGATATITSEKSVVDGRQITKTTIDGRTKGLAESLWHVHDIFSSTYDEQFLPLTAYRDIHEGKSYTKREDLTFDRSQSTVTSSLAGTEKASPNLRDMVSALMCVANVDYSKMNSGTRRKYYMYHEEKQFPVEVRYNGVEEVKLNKKTYKCYSISPLVDPGNLLEQKDALTVYVDVESHKIISAKLHFKLAGFFRLELMD